MKKTTSIFCTLIFLLTACSGIFVSAKENVEVVFSETFEGDLSRWVFDGVDNISILDSEDEYIGSYVCIGAGKSVGKGIPMSSGQGISSPMIDIEADETYTFAVDVKSEDTQKAHIDYYDEKGFFLKSQNYIITPADKMNWSCFSKVIEAPDTASKMQIYLACKADRLNSWAAEYDNVLLCKGNVGFNKDIERRMKYAPLAVDDSSTIMAKENAVFYDAFENGIKEWTLYNKKSEYKVKTSTNNVSTGLRALFITDEYVETPVGAESKNFDAIPGAVYTLSFDACNSSGKNLEVSLRFFDENNKLVYKHLVKTYTKQWATYTDSILVPSDAKYAQIRIITEDYIGKNYLDIIKVTTDITAPVENEETQDSNLSKFEEITNQSLLLFIGSANALVNGEKTLIDKTNDKVVAGIVNSRTLVPVRFIAENYGAEVLWEDLTKTVTLKLSDKIVTIVLNNNKIKIDEEIITIDVPAQTIEGRTMLPLRAFVEQVMGKKVFWDQRGLIVITDESILDPSKDGATIDKLINVVTE